MRRAAILDFEVGVGELTPDFRSRNSDFREHSNLNFPTGNSKIQTSRFKLNTPLQEGPTLNVVLTNPTQSAFNSHRFKSVHEDFSITATSFTKCEMF